MAGIERTLRAVLILLTAALVGWTIGSIAWHQGYEEGVRVGAETSWHSTFDDRSRLLYLPPPEHFAGGSITPTGAPPGPYTPGYYYRISP